MTSIFNSKNIRTGKRYKGQFTAAETQSGYISTHLQIKQTNQQYTPVLQKEMKTK